MLVFGRLGSGVRSGCREGKTWQREKEEACSREGGGGANVRQSSQARRLGRSLSFMETSGFVIVVAAPDFMATVTGTSQWVGCSETFFFYNFFSLLEGGGKRYKCENQIKMLGGWSLCRRVPSTRVEETQDLLVFPLFLPRTNSRRVSRNTMLLFLAAPSLGRRGRR